LIEKIMCVTEKIICNRKNYFCYKINQPVVVQDGADPVGDGDHRGLGELGADALLDERVRGHVDGRCRFVEHNQRAPAENGPTEAQQLPLAHTVCVSNHF
jgi:hypothetical protein